MAGATGYRYTFSRRQDGPTNLETSHLFERIGTDEFAEIQQYRQVIDALKERIQDLERINIDLEYRLEEQARQCLSAEKECSAVKREWVTKCESLQNEINHWKEEQNLEQQKSAKLREQNSRTEREMYRILQRKYELIRGNAQQQSRSTSQSQQQEDGKNLNLIPEEKNITPQQKRTIHSLQEFFGL